jgi:C4-dicarboxylate-specific signal transduction histidine kinase
VEADPEARHVLPRFLERRGRVEVARSIAEARAAVAAEVPSLVVIDPDLPDGDGTGFVAEVRERFPWVQILVLCSLERSEETAFFIASGANDVLVRPFDIGVLLPRIEWLQRAVELRRGEFEKLRQLESRLQQMDRVTILGTLLATVGHEIANPLAAVLTSASLVRDTLAPGQEPNPADVAVARESVDEILTASKQIQSVLARIRTFSRRDEDAAVRASLSGAVSTALLFLRRKVGGTGVSVHAPPADQGPVVLHSPSRITQAVANAAGNALEALPPGGNVWISYRETEEDVIIVVEDDGPGLTEEMRKQVLTPFFTTKPTGTGLGMSVMQDVMKEHRGRLALGVGPGGRGLSVQMIMPRR